MVSSCLNYFRRLEILLGTAVGSTLGVKDTTVLGSIDGTTLGSILGSMLGTALGVEHTDGTVPASWQESCTMNENIFSNMLSIESISSSIVLNFVATKSSIESTLSSMISNFA